MDKRIPGCVCSIGRLRIDVPKHNNGCGNKHGSVRGGGIRGTGGAPCDCPLQCIRLGAKAFARLGHTIVASSSLSTVASGLAPRCCLPRPKHAECQAILRPAGDKTAGMGTGGLGNAAGQDGGACFTLWQAWRIQCAPPRLRVDCVSDSRGKEGRSRVVGVCMQRGTWFARPWLSGRMAKTSCETWMHAKLALRPLWINKCGHIRRDSSCMTRMACPRFTGSSPQSELAAFLPGGGCTRSACDSSISSTDSQ